MTPQVRRQILAGVKGAFYVGIGALSYAYLQPDPEPEYQTATVTRRALEQDKPVAKQSIGDRIAHSTKKPTMTATAVGGATKTVDDFCSDTLSHAPLVASVAGDSIVAPAPPAPTVHMLFDAMTYSGHNLKLWEVKGNGNATTESFSVHSPFTVAIKDGSALVRGSRTWWVKPVLKGAAIFGAGYVAGHVR